MQLIVFFFFFFGLKHPTQRGFACGPEISPLIQVLAILFVAWIYRTARATTFNSHMTVSCVTLWDSARPDNTHGWIEGKEAAGLERISVGRVKHKGGRGNQQLRLQGIPVLCMLPGRVAWRKLSRWLRRKRIPASM